MAVEHNEEIGPIAVARCPGCERNFRVQRSALGCKATCKRCGTDFVLAEVVSVPRAAPGDESVIGAVNGNPPHSSAGADEKHGPRASKSTNLARDASADTDASSSPVRTLDPRTVRVLSVAMSISVLAICATIIIVSLHGRSAFVGLNARQPAESKQPQSESKKPPPTVDLWVKQPRRATQSTVLRVTELPKGIKSIGVPVYFDGTLLTRFQFLTPEGTKCIELKDYVGIENEWTEYAAKVKITEGTYSGHVGWVPRKWLVTE